MTLYAFITENSDLMKKECIVEREVFYDEGGSEIKAVYSGKLKRIPISLTVSEMLDSSWSDDGKTLKIMLTPMPPKEEMLTEMRDIMYYNPEVYKLVERYLNASDFGRDEMVSAALNGSLKL